MSEQVFIKMLRFSKALNESNIPLLWELGHYLIDNLINKICIFVAKEKGRDNDIYKNITNKRTKDFPDLYKDILQTLFPRVPDYDNDVDSHHHRRNIFQHSEDSIETSMRHEYVPLYISIVENIMTEIGIIDSTNDISPLNLLKSSVQRTSDSTRITTPITDSKPEFIKILNFLLKRYIFKYYHEVKTDTKQDITARKVNGLVNKLIELGDNQAKSFINKEGSVQHQKIFKRYHKVNTNKVEELNLEEERVERQPMIRAGDLALIFKESYDRSILEEKSYVKNIRGIFAVSLGEEEFLGENYDPIRFSVALQLLEEKFGIIELSGPDFEGSESLTEWKIINLQRLEEFVEKKSINNILRQLS